MQVRWQVRLQASQVQVRFVLHEAGLHVLASRPAVQVSPVLHETGVPVFPSGRFRSGDRGDEPAGEIHLAATRLSVPPRMYKPRCVILIGSLFWSMKDYFVQVNNEISLSSVSWHEVISIIGAELTSRLRNASKKKKKKERKASSVQLRFIMSDCSFIFS